VAWEIASNELWLAMAKIGVDAMTCNHAVALRAKVRATVIQLQTCFRRI